MFVDDTRPFKMNTFINQQSLFVVVYITYSPILFFYCYNTPVIKVLTSSNHYRVPVVLSYTKS